MKAGRVAFARLARRRAGTPSLLVGRLSPYLLVLPTVCLVATFVWYPLLRAVQASLYQWDGVGELGRFVALANYQRMFLDDPIFRNALRNTLLWAVMYTAIPTLIGLAVALLVDSDVHGEALFKGAIFVPWAISPVVVGFIWTQMYNPSSGLVDGVLRAVGLGGLARPWLADSALALPAINLAASWVRTGFAMIIFLAALRGIPSDLIEAARIDGASVVQGIWHIVLPLLRPAFTVVIGTSLMLSIGAFDEVWVMTKGGPGFSTYLLSVYLYISTFQTHQAGLGAAIGVVMFLLAGIGGFLYVRQMIRGEVSY
jgi:raffinose/stachyose/melibiose transport system permease protein